MVVLVVVVQVGRLNGGGGRAGFGELSRGPQHHLCVGVISTQLVLTQQTKPTDTSVAWHASGDWCPAVMLLWHLLPS